ncbi:hypothetical protein [Chloroflexus sp.]|uniref:hypothetical protein n=1 Tax=Chloroflexus sp. TaxID=1904827 RepID=UPI0040492028
MIVENLCNLAVLTSGARYTFACLPLKLAEADGAPARVLAWVDDTSVATQKLM